MHPVPSLPDTCPGGSVKSSARKLILVSDASATWRARGLGSLASEESCDAKGWDALCRVMSGGWVGALAQAAIAKYLRLGGFSIRHLFLTVLQAKRSQIEVPACLGS